MQSETIVLLFDIILFILGIYALACAIRMKKTAIPSAILIPKEEMPKMKNTKDFCQKMYVPTVLFAVVICLYGVIDIFNRYVWKLRCFATLNKNIESKSLDLSALADFFYVNIYEFICCLILCFT